MKSFRLLGCLGILMLSGIVAAQTDAVAEQMQWFKDAKFGMFIHFQAPRNGDFNPSNFDAAEWVRIAKAGGMKYMTLTTSQSSHIPLWNSSVSDQDVTDRTSWKRDIVKELAAACKAEGIRMGCYYPIADPYNPLYNEPDVGGEIRPYVEYLHSVIKELCENYQPCLIWFDASRRFRDPAEKPLLRRQDMVDMLHSYGTLSNSRLGDDDALKYVDYLTMNDNMAPSINLGVHFESAVTMGGSWHFRANDNLKSPKVLLEQLINTAGNGGNYLLNVGPDRNGVIPKEMEERLKIMGQWLKKNGEAIYATEPGPYRYEISWGTITQRKGKDSTALYLNVADWPKDGKMTLFGVNNPVQNASLLATREAIEYESKFDVFSGQNIITLNIPKEAPDEYVSVIKLVVAGTVSMDPAHMQLNDGKVIMDTYNATIHDAEYVPGKPTKAIDMKMFTVPDRRPLLPGEITGPWDYQMYRKSGEGVMPGRAITVSGFGTKGQALSWDFKLYKPGTYEIVLDGRGVGSQNWDRQGKLRAHVAGQSLENTLNFDNSGKARFGTVQIDVPGTYTFILEVASDFRNAPRYGSVTLAPVTQDTSKTEHLDDRSLLISDGSRFVPKDFYPKFSWGTTPMYYMFGDTQRVLHPKEVEFIASRTAYLCIEKSHGRRQLGAAELGAKHEAAAFKKIKPEMKVLFYFNAARAWPFTSYSKNFTPGTIDDYPELKKLLLMDPKTGEPQLHGNILCFDVLKPEMRQWWTDTVAKGVAESGCDGAFIDQMHGYSWLREGNQGEVVEKAMGLLMAGLKEKMGPDKILLANNANQKIAKHVFPVMDACMFEHYNEKLLSKESLLQDWEDMLRIAKAGKMSIFRIGVESDPSPSPQGSSRDYSHLAKERIEYYLACYLIGAQPYSYFQYGWGWTLSSGSLHDYPELQKPLGPPKGAYQRTTSDGWEFTREFEHASVWVNTETRQAKITWR